MDTLSEALALAMEAHEGQKRKISGAPYIVHIFDVVKLLLYADAPGHVVVAGALHDLLEDTHTSEAKLERRFGKETMDLVRFCTEPGNTPDSTDDELLRTWRSRKEHAVEKAKAASDEELLLKLADALANMISLTEDQYLFGEGIWETFRGGKEGNRWYFNALGEVFKERFPDHKLYRIYELQLSQLFPEK